MMLAALVIGFVLFFGIVLLAGAPYLPVLKRQKEVALDLLALKPGQTLLDLGSGDGRMLKAAARRDINSVGYELNPILVLISWLTTIKYRKKVKIIWGDFWSKDWHEADGIYVFLHTDFMKKLDNKVSTMDKNIMLASVAYKIPGKRPAKTKEGVFLYQY